MAWFKHYQPQVYAEMDADASGTISLSEFLMGVGIIKKQMLDTAANAFFTPPSPSNPC